ncbi:hypothetical protein BC829DRAFT_55641 [Chytridium lagenaria]|nr:hypothetical protein BC829DRAFT_55641 [Chytridium lagenaria]
MRLSTLAVALGLIATASNAFVINSGSGCWQSNGINRQLTVTACRANDAAQNFTIRFAGTGPGVYLHSESHKACVNLGGSSNTVILSTCTASLVTSMYATANSNQFIITQNDNCMENENNNLVSRWCSWEDPQRFTLPLTKENDVIGPIRVGSFCLQNNGWERLTIAACTNSPKQLFRVFAFGGGINVRSADNVLCMDVFWDDTSTNSEIGMWECKREVEWSNNQIFFSTTPGMHSGQSLSLITNLATRCLRVQSLTANSGLSLGDCNGSSAQTFRLPFNSRTPVMPTTSTSISVRTASGSMACLEVLGSRIILLPCNPIKLQQWR